MLSLLLQDPSLIVLACRTVTAPAGVIVKTSHLAASARWESNNARMTGECDARWPSA